MAKYSKEEVLNSVISKMQSGGQAAMSPEEADAFISSLNLVAVPSRRNFSSDVIYTVKKNAIEIVKTGDFDDRHPTKRFSHDERYENLADGNQYKIPGAVALFKNVLFKALTQATPVGRNSMWIPEVSAKLGDKPALSPLSIAKSLSDIAKGDPEGEDRISLRLVQNKVKFPSPSIWVESFCTGNTGDSVTIADDDIQYDC